MGIGSCFVFSEAHVYLKLQNINFLKNLMQVTLTKSSVAAAAAAAAVTNCKYSTNG